jgi:hypothetical protein
MVRLQVMHICIDLKIVGNISLLSDAKVIDLECTFVACIPLEENILSVNIC